MTAPAELETFVQRRDERWRALETLLDGAEREAELGPERLMELVRLYRLSCSDLNRLRTLTANPDLLGRVNRIVARGYRTIYQHRMRRWPRLELRRWLGRDMPDTVRREWRFVLASALALLLGAALGFTAVARNPDDAAGLVPPGLYVEHPRERVAALESGPERIDSAEKATSFGAFLYSHNIEVSFVAFTLSAATLFLGWLLVFYNGVLLGAVAAQYAVEGVGTFFLAWVGPHGVLELPAIVLAAAAGLRMGWAVVVPGEIGRPAAIRAAFAPAAWLLATSVLLLVFAGIIEGSFSQFSARLVPYPWKIAAAGVLATGLLGWLGVPRRRSRGT